MLARCANSKPCNTSRLVILLQWRMNLCMNQPVPPRAQIYADFYGRKHLGQITSYDAMLNTIGTAIGPLIFSSFRAYFGSYHQVLYLFSIPPLVSSVLCFSLLKKPPLPSRAKSMYAGGYGEPSRVGVIKRPRELVQSSGGATLSPAKS